MDLRISLKPTQDFNYFLETAFKLGRCECMRCVEADHDESDYTNKHNFNIDDQIVSRRFAETTGGDFINKLTKAWESFYQAPLGLFEAPVEPEEIETAEGEEVEQIEQLKPLSKVEVGDVTVMVLSENFSRFNVLAQECGLLKDDVFTLAK